MTSDNAAEILRMGEVDRLMLLGSAAITPLMAMLEDPAWTVRRAVVASLGALGVEAVEPLTRSLQSDRKSERRIAATVDALVASTGDVETVMAELATHPDPAVTADVAQILGRRRLQRAVPTLVELARHKDDNVAVAAIEALGRVGGRAAIDALVEAVESRLFFRTFPAIDVLGRSGDPRAVEPLAALLTTSQYAFEAARALGRTGHRAAVAPLAMMLASPADGNVRVGAAALYDLWQRHKDGYGSATGIEEALQGAVADTGLRRLAQCIGGADPVEQVAICGVLGVLRDPAVSPTLARLLDGPPAVAAAAARALQRIGSASDVEILKAVASGGSAQRQVLLPLLNRSRGDEIVRCLTDPDPSVRALACDALGRLGHTAAVPQIFQLLGDTNPRVVQAAIGAAQSLGSAETHTLAMKAAMTSSVTVRRAALRVLAYFGRIESLPAFQAGLVDPDLRVRDAAIQGLAFLEGPGALDLLLQTSSSSSEKSRAAAMRALGQCRSDVRVSSSLLRGLADGDAWVRYYACQSLGKLALEESAPAIDKLLTDPAGQVRVAAVEALSHLRSDAAHEALCRAATSPEPDVQRAGLIGLGMAGRPESLPLLMAATTSSDAATRLVALSALAELPAVEVLPVLARAAADDDESVRTAALGFLASRDGADATRVMIGFLATPGDEATRVLDALAVPVAGRVEGVLQSLADADDELAPQLTSVLARLNRADATAALHQALTLPSVPARKAAATTLAAMGRRALDTLRTMAADDPSPDVRRLCAVLLAQ